MIGMDFLRWWLLLLTAAFSCRLGAQPLPELIPYKTATGWGYSDSNRVIKVPCIYRSASLFYNGKGRVTVERDSEIVHCLIDRTGNYIIGPELHWTGKMSWQANEGILNVHNDSGHWGRVDTAGRIVIPMRYDRPTEGRRSHAFRLDKAGNLFFGVFRAGKFLLLDTAGRVRIGPDKEIVRAFGWNAGDSIQGWLVRKEGKWGLNGRFADELLPCRYDSIYVQEWNNDRSGVAVRKDSLWGWYTMATGEEIAPRFKYPPSAAGPYVAGVNPETGNSMLLWHR